MRSPCCLRALKKANPLIHIALFQEPLVRTDRFLTLLVFLLASSAESADIAPDFNLKTPEGKRLHLQAMLEEGPVLLDFWATWCKPCLKGMPKIQSIYETYRERGLAVVGVNEDGPRGQAKVKPFVRARKITFPIALDSDGRLMKRIRAVTLPTTILIDRDGEIVLRQSGYSPEGEQALIDAIESLLTPTRDGESAES